MITKRLPGGLVAECQEWSWYLEDALRKWQCADAWLHHASEEAHAVSCARVDSTDENKFVDECMAKVERASGDFLFRLLCKAAPTSVRTDWAQWHALA